MAKKKYDFSEIQSEKRLRLLQKAVASACDKASKARLVRLNSLYDIAKEVGDASLCLEISERIYKAESSVKEFL